MGLAEGIRKHGFRKWYERELISSHAHLVLLVLCALGLLGALEAYERQAPLQAQLTNVVAVILCAAIGFWAMRRYLYLLMHAEATAHQAVCPQCQAYGRMVVVAEDRARGLVGVRCKVCGHEWPIDDSA